MRPRYALGPVLTGLLILATTTATSATQPAAPSAVGGVTPLALSLVAGQADAALDQPIDGPGTASDAAAFVLEDPGAAPVPMAALRSQPVPARGVVSKAPPQSRARAVITRGGGSDSIRGLASWYCNSNPSRGPISSCYSAYPDTRGFNAYAAAGPRLRNALGSGWRGRVVTVNGVRVKLVDWCQCYQGQANEKLIDLYRDVFAVTGGSVTIRW
jgi:hypothetical protein